MSKIQRDTINKIRQEIIDAHELFSDAFDSQHAFLDVAEKTMDMILEDNCYGCIDRD